MKSSGIAKLIVSPREGGGIAGVDVQEIARRLVGEVGGEEIDALRDVLGIDGALQQRALAVMLLELVLGDLERGGALGTPGSLPDLGAAQHRVGIDGVHANAVWSSLQ